jgi:hypothetical protein
MGEGAPEGVVSVASVVLGVHRTASSHCCTVGKKPLVAWRPATASTLGLFF